MTLRKIYLSKVIHHGSRMLELALSNLAVKLNTPFELVTTLQVIKSSVENDELDTAIDVAANKIA